MLSHEFTKTLALESKSVNELLDLHVAPQVMHVYDTVQPEQARDKDLLLLQAWLAGGDADECARRPIPRVMSPKGICYDMKTSCKFVLVIHSRPVATTTCYALPCSPVVV